ncbi:MAG: isopentenyl-diphosphate Delta-isomerase [Chitinophagaceae bacterium]|nr:isopentenyl-diphosphate Delta-isomerase [Bacteroidota bacterium]MCC6257021.1 isopentenyl-diphosphate Delta-isomerase [Chitinophagaceae bacterium]
MDLILVNEADEPVGTMEKMEVHQKALLHRAFSIFIFNSKNELLLQQRALDKYHSAGLWSNTCCSHPSPGEDTAHAAAKRLKEEMGIETPLQHAFHFIYRAEFENQLTEHELDHVFVGKFDGEPEPNPNEVSDISYQTVEQLLSDMKENPQNFTVWFKLILPRLANEHKASEI